MQELLTIISFCFGAAIGSFINVVIYRLPRRISFWRIGERSHCPFCKKDLEGRDLIPIVSFILLHGKCRHCKKHISWQYILVELFFALSFAIVFWQVGLTFIASKIAILLVFLVPLFVIDAKHKIVPDALSLPFIGVAAIIGFSSDLIWHEVLLGAGIGGLFFFIQWAVSRGRWVGSGDIRLGLGMGFLLGWEFVLMAIVMAYLAGTLFAVVALAMKRKSLKSTIAFGPFLLLAAFVAYLWGPQILEWYFGLYYIGML